MVFMLFMFLASLSVTTVVAQTPDDPIRVFCMYEDVSRAGYEYVAEYLKYCANELARPYPYNITTCSYGQVKAYVIPENDYYTARNCCKDHLIEGVADRNKLSNPNVNRKLNFLTVQPEGFVIRGDTFVDNVYAAYQVGNEVMDYYRSRKTSTFIDYKPRTTLDKC